jgi:nucleoside-diphosphate-sugar epimerase
LITGGLGFTGRRLVEYLVEIGEEPILLVRSKDSISKGDFPVSTKVLTLSDLREQIGNLQIGSVFHLATSYMYSPNAEQITQLIDSNIELPTQIAQLLLSEKMTVDWVNVSTFMQHYESMAYCPTSIYAATKQAAEDILKYFEVIGSIRLKTVIFPNIYGENDKRPKLLNYLISCIEENQTATLASGTQVLELLHVDDAVRALVEVRNLPIGRWQIPHTEHYKVRELVLLLNQAAGIEMKVTMDPSLDRVLDQYDVWISGSEIPNFQPKVKIFDWMRETLGKAGN